MESRRCRGSAKPLVPEKDSIVAMRAEYEERLNGLYGDIGRLTTQLTWLKKKSGIEC
jgi:transposase